MFGDPIKNEKGWKVSNFGKNFEVSSGGTPSTKISEYWENGNISWIGSNLCQNKILNENDGKYITELGYENSSAKLYAKGTILIALVGATIGKTALLKFPTATNQNIAGVEVDNNKFSSDFVFFVAQLLYPKFQGIGKNKFKMANLKFIKDLPIIIPSLQLQNEFASFVTKTNKLKFLYNFILDFFVNLLKKLIKEVLFFLTFLIISANIRLDIELAEKEKKMKYYRRSIEQVINEYKEQFPILLLTGPRQVGKSTLFKELFREEYKYFSLDDPILKEQIVNDPRLFLKNNPEKLIIDEVQYAPSIFPYLKMKVDENREDGMYLMTGSQAFVLMKNVSETLAGRVGILELQGISLREQFDIEFNRPFIPNDEYIAEREKKITEYTNLWQRIHRGYMPELIFNDRKKWEFFYSSYVQTYIERDVRDLINISDESKFLKFMISLASRSGELLNYGAVANEVGISNETVKRWVSVLRTSRIIYLLEPYFNNHLKRVIKTPKIYFMDVGLLAYLTKWPTPETLANGAKAGNIFETFIISEIVKSYLNAGIINPPLYFYRDKDKKEIDLIIEEAEKIYPIEIKMSASPNKEMAKNFSVLKRKIDKEIGTGIIICQYDNKVYLSEDILVLPVEYI